MSQYYYQSGIKRAIIDFVYSGSPNPRRECAFYNEKIEQIQRHTPEKGNESILVLDTEEKILKTLQNHGKAFYTSVWHYENPQEPSGVRGRDITWTIKSTKGGLETTKKITKLFLEALEEEGFSDPLVKYSGKLGFDILIPLNKIQTGSPKDVEFLSDIHKNLTSNISDYITKNSSFDLKEKGSTLKFSGKLGTCLLTELRWRRGLLLAPMSLHPGSGLVSVPLLPGEISSFSVVDASPENVQAREWSIPHTVSGERARSTVLHSPKGKPVKASF